MQIHETLHIATRDNWGFPGVCTHQREAWQARGSYMAARATCSDTSSDHGWGGSVTHEEWRQTRKRAAAWCAPYRFPDGEAYPETATPGDCEGWAVYTQNHEPPRLYASRPKAMAVADAIARGEKVDNGRQWPVSRGVIHI